jgi:hypothetical protein
MSLSAGDRRYLWRWGMALLAACGASTALIVCEAVAGCGARPTFAGGMPGLAVPINDAPPRRIYDSGAP